MPRKQVMGVRALRLDAGLDFGLILCEFVWVFGNTLAGEGFEACMVCIY